MRRWLYIVLIWLPLAVHAEQGQVYFHPDTTESDTKYKYYFDLTKKPDALKAVWLGAIFPGAGQMYNRSFWKLPIVYGAFLGCGYAISVTHGRYASYKKAYLDLYYDNMAGTVSEDESKSYIAVLPEGYTLERVGGANRWMSILNSRQSAFRRSRDYAILGTVLVYALSLIDAYVDAQLFDYDISPDLSMKIEPQIYFDQHQQECAEMKFAIRF